MQSSACLQHHLINNHIFDNSILFLLKKWLFQKLNLSRQIVCNDAAAVDSVIWHFQSYWFYSETLHIPTLNPGKGQKINGGDNAQHCDYHFDEPK